MANRLNRKKQGFQKSNSYIGPILPTRRKAESPIKLDHVCKFCKTYLFIKRSSFLKYTPCAELSLVSSLHVLLSVAKILLDHKRKSRL